MGPGRERIRRGTFMGEKEELHYPEWIEAINEEEDHHHQKKSHHPQNPQ